MSVSGAAPRGMGPKVVVVTGGSVMGGCMGGGKVGIGVRGGKV